MTRVLNRVLTRSPTRSLTRCSLRCARTAACRRRRWTRTHPALAGPVAAKPAPALSCLAPASRTFCDSATPSTTCEPASMLIERSKVDGGSNAQCVGMAVARESIRAIRCELKKAAYGCRNGPSSLPSSWKGLLSSCRDHCSESRRWAGASAFALRNRNMDTPARVQPSQSCPASEFCKWRQEEKRVSDRRGEQSKNGGSSGGGTS